MNNKIDLKNVAWFLTLAFVPTVAVSVIIRSIQVNLAGKTMVYYNLFLLAVMFFPGVSAFIVRKFITKESCEDSGLRFGSWKP